MRICIYAKDVPNRHKRDNLYPVGHLSLLSPECTETCEIPRSQNRASINAFLICLLPSAADVQTSPAQVHGAKVQQNLRMCKFLVEKVLEVLKVLRVIGWFLLRNR